MDKEERYKIVYTQKANETFVEKASYIMRQYRDPNLAETWYTRLRSAVQEDLVIFPKKYPLYQNDVRLFLFRNDVVLYSVNDQEKCVYIHGVFTKGADINEHMKKT